MVYIATVHWQDDKWIDIQNLHLKKFIKFPFKVYAFLDNIEIQHHCKFDYTETDHKISHAEKLNYLAERISKDSGRSDDVIIFLDGDAFPISDLTPLLTKIDTEIPLIAARRYIEEGDIQPHPCFCITSVGFWQDIKGDWREGYQWQNKRNKLVTDVGGNLLKNLNHNRVEWHPLDRSNRVDLHPLLYAVYGDYVYHHGAGFRDPVFRSSQLSGNRIKVALHKFIMKITNQRVRQLFSKDIRGFIKTDREILQYDKDLSRLIYYCIHLNPAFIKEYFLNQKD